MVGNNVIAVLSSHKAVKEVIDTQGNSTADRPQTTIGDTVTGGVHMAQAHSDDPRWLTLRRAVRSVLTKQKCEEHWPIQRAESIQFMFDTIHDSHSFHKHVKRYTLSVISSITYGCRFPRFDSKECADFYAMVDKWSELMEPGRHPPIDLLPILKLIPEKFAAWRQEAKVVRQMQHQLYFHMLDCVNDRFKHNQGVGAFMEDIIQKKDQLGLDRELMAYLGGVLLEGGADTTASYLNSFHLAMVAFPEIQKKAHEEIDRVIGPDRIPTLEDIADLPYVRAIIREVHRWRPGAPLGLPHASTEDVHYNGYVIPKGSTIFINVWGISHDPELYDRPEDFWPDRFLKNEFGTRDGVDVSAWRDKLIFGGGKRICPGTNLAYNSINFNTTFLLWAFNFEKSVDPVTKRQFTPDVWGYSKGLFIMPNKFPSEIVPRSSGHVELITQSLQDSAGLYAQFETQLDTDDKNYLESIRRTASEF
ncbi:cytochrome P450 [Crepidotus variabilis]|uniref:Cytochrome P450 n=1 Tax=Crepidotus variabilis TaxID=179855 RepID=A0A9P6EAQ9_9AGAR|nr:cytochrome P450 [Crepidotus variabilis]